MANNKDIKVTEEADQIAAQYKKKELQKLAKERDVDYPSDAKEAEIAQLLLDAGVFEEEDDNDDPKSKKKTDDVDNDAEGADDDDDADDDDEVADEEDGSGELLSAPPGQFVYYKVGTAVRVFYPDGKLCTVYTKERLANSDVTKKPEEAAKMFCDKKNSQFSGGMAREGAKSRPKYPKGATRATNYKT